MEAAFFDISEPVKIPLGGGEAGEESKEIERFSRVLERCRKDAVRATKVSSYPMLERARAAATKLLKQLWQYAKQAVEIATLKFFIELAAMVVSAVTAAMVAKTGRPMDITTSGVFCGVNGQTGVQPTAAKQSGFDSNPFSEWNSSPSNRNSASPW